MMAARMDTDLFDQTEWQGVCEACGEVRATEVHHLTYKHIGSEFLWELVAICRACHERYHKARHG